MQQEIETLKHTIATQRELSAEELNSHNTRIYLLETNQAASEVRTEYIYILSGNLWVYHADCLRQMCHTQSMIFSTHLLLASLPLGRRRTVPCVSLLQVTLCCSGLCSVSVLQVTAGLAGTDPTTATSGHGSSGSPRNNCNAIR